jgi:hypothetical protein
MHASGVHNVHAENCAFIAVMGALATSPAMRSVLLQAEAKAPPSSQHAVLLKNVLQWIRSISAPGPSPADVDARSVRKLGCLCWPLEL